MRSRREAGLLVLLMLIMAAGWMALFLSERGNGDRLEQMPSASVPTETVDLHSASARAASAAAFAAIDAARSFTLSNGLQVVLIPDDTVAELTNAVWYQVGSADDPVGKSGLAHFVEHLTFGQIWSKHYPEFSAFLERLGDKQDAFTTFDYTVYYQRVNRQQLDNALTLEAHRMARLQIDQTGFNAERREVLEERREAEQRPEALLGQSVRAVLYKDHPYGAPGLGRREEFDSISAVDAAKFHGRWYGPNNAILILHGLGELPVIKSLAENYLGNIPAREPGVRAMPRPITGAVSQTVVLRDTRANVSVWRRDYLAPSYTAGATEHVYALQVLAEVLAGGPESGLHRKLVQRDKRVVGVDVQYDPDAIDQSSFSIFVSFNSGTDAAGFAQAVEVELQALGRTLLMTRHLEHTKEDLKTRAGLPGPGSMPAAVRLAGEALVRGRTLDDVRHWPKSIDGTTAEQVQNAARILLAANAIDGLLLHSSAERDALTRDDRRRVAR